MPLNNKRITKHTTAHFIFASFKSLHGKPKDSVIFNSKKDSNRYFVEKFTKNMSKFKIVSVILFYS